MEYTQWERKISAFLFAPYVLILVVMEYTQWAPQIKDLGILKKCLNPCCNGIYSMSLLKDKLKIRYGE